MLKISYSRYSLQPTTALNSVAAANSRQGALLRVEGPDHRIGYADLFPWPEFGDLTLDHQISLLCRLAQFDPPSFEKLSPVLAQTLCMAQRDAERRAQKKSAFSDMAQVRHHFLIPDLNRVDEARLTQAGELGFKALKIKVGKDPETELRLLDRLCRQHSDFSLRLDCNSSFEFSEFKEFIASIASAHRSRIEFVEDPTPYDFDKWRMASQFATLALDFEFDRVNWGDLSIAKKPFQILIFKPARQNSKTIRDLVSRLDLKLVVTSSMDHPVGVAHAIWSANEMKALLPAQILDCGCLSFHAYDPNEYFRAVQIKGPVLEQIHGTGIGFDSLLEKEVWTSIN